VDEAMFKKRTRNVALRVIKLVNALPNSRVADVIGRASFPANPKSKIQNLK
jgi:hypothetical protein